VNILPKETKEKATTESVQVQLDLLTQRNERLAEDLQIVSTELLLAKKSLKEIEADYRARVKTAYALDIQHVLGCAPAKLRKITEGKTIAELKQMLADFIVAKGPQQTQKGKDKHIRAPIAGAARHQNIRLTVGDLTNKSRQEILEMKGDFYA